MATQADHIQATIAQMQQAVAEQRRVLAEMEETLAALQRTPGYLKSGAVGTHLTPTPTVEKVAGGTRTLANRNVTAFVRDYLAEYHKYDEKINIGEIVDYQALASSFLWWRSRFKICRSCLSRMRRWGIRLPSLPRGAIR